MLWDSKSPLCTYLMILSDSSFPSHLRKTPLTLLLYKFPSTNTYFSVFYFSLKSAKVQGF